MLILIPILATIFAVIYILSPIDFLPELVFGPVGLADDVVAILIAVGAWMLYFSFPLLEMLFYLVIGLGLLVLMGYIIAKLYSMVYGKKKVKLRIRK